MRSFCRRQPRSGTGSYLLIQWHESFLCRSISGCHCS
uniref:Uncharacterized protein n=1 Tax=Salix viminalis TaxID=40686 RepID=A0A6N2MDM9_SALVM